MGCNQAEFLLSTDVEKARTGVIYVVVPVCAQADIFISAWRPRGCRPTYNGACTASRLRIFIYVRLEI